MLESIRDLAEGVATAFYVLGTISILLRIYSRAFVIKQFGWDDWCMSSILLFHSGHQAILYFFTRHGAGLQIEYVFTYHPEWMPKLVRGLFAEEIMYTFMHFIIKTAFLLFYLRFATKTFRKLVYVTIGLNTAMTLAIILLYCFQCLPLDAFFNPQKHPNVKCVDNNFLAFVPASFSIFIDVLIVILPIRSLWAIQVSLRKRIALIAIISLGAVVVLISCIRLSILLEFQKKTTDFTYVLGKLIIISVIELEVAIMAANAPSLKILFQTWLGLKSNNGSRNTNAKNLGDSSRSGKPKHHDLGYAVDCTNQVPMKNRDKQVAVHEHRLQHSDSEEQLWKQDSGIILQQQNGGIMVDRSVNVEVSRNSAVSRLPRNVESSNRVSTASSGEPTISPADLEKRYKNNFDAV